MARPSSRFFHRALLAAYLAAGALFFGLLVRGVTLSIIEEMGLGASRPGSCGARTPAFCRERLVELRRQLDVKLAEAEQGSGSRAERLWDEWSVGWRRDLARVAGDCCLDAEEVPAGFRGLAHGERDLRELEALYTTHVVQYAREIGAKAEAVDRELELNRPAAPSSALPPRNDPARP
ncbi:MAG: hypothetical protein ACYDCL_17955 [Myxococcales bacterium]